MLENIFEQFFKPEVRKSGEELFLKKSVVLSSKSDTSINAYVKSGTSVRVTLTSNSIESDSFRANCSCPKNSTLCKHIWAVLLATENEYSDFLTTKTIIEKIESTNSKASAYKEKQSDYRKAQYQKQKLKVKNSKLQKLALEEEALKFPIAIENALVYFSQNGFPLETPIKEDALNNARKKLARIFHPDLGGTHTETVDLNKNYDTLVRFFGV